MIKASNLFKEFKLSKKQKQENGTSEEVYRAVNDVSFECKPGRIFSLLGPNGAGKTTTLRMLSTMVVPTTTKITVEFKYSTFLLQTDHGPEQWRMDILFLEI